MIQIEIDNGSGFCFGVTTAIKKGRVNLEFTLPKPWVYPT